MISASGLPRLLVLFFLASGFTGLLYQVVWLRLSMAAFGVTSAMVSIVVSLFMAGLALGSRLGGALAARRATANAAEALRWYAACETLMALSPQVVPRGLEIGRDLLAQGDAGWGSTTHYLVAGGWVLVLMLPFCTAMGATFPLAIWALRRGAGGEAERGFGRLYLANVFGACAGTLVSAFVLIEMFGFRGTLAVAATMNAVVAASALLAGLRPLPVAEDPVEDTATPATPALASPPLALATLFATGFVSMGLEVIWIRQYTPYLGTFVYAFAIILGIYLLATTAGTMLYRFKPGGTPSGLLLAVGLTALLPLPAIDPQLFTSWVDTLGPLRTLLGLVPFCILTGYLTPLLVERHAGGDPDRVGRAYAVNVVGCILGPLVAGFALLPLFGDRGALLALALPVFPLALALGAGRIPVVAGMLIAVGLTAVTSDYETKYEPRMVRRDATATVVAAGGPRTRRLLVNGIGMTYLTPITKFMAHAPLALLADPPKKSLVICFGMGTTWRSMLSWNIEATAVELVPSVVEVFPYFYGEAGVLRAQPGAHIVVDDGRRFLARSRETFDMITIDPPPPFEAAGTSLLYSREFYELIRQRLRPGGILAQWIPRADRVSMSACVKAIQAVFPYVRTFQSVEDVGVHFFASDVPVPRLTAAELAAKLPPAAAKDLVELGPRTSAEENFAELLAREVEPADLIAPAAGAPMLIDDRPLNEYFFLRWLRNER